MSLSWQESFAVWYLRIWCTMMLCTAISILVYNQPGWEDMFTTELSAEETAIARTGVMFDHGFQATTWILVILVSEFGDAFMRQLALGVTAFAMLLNGFIGLKYFYVGCDAYDLCLDGADAIRGVSLAVTLLGVIAIVLNWDIAKGQRARNRANYQTLE